jgi:hypothetical protein
MCGLAHIGAQRREPKANGRQAEPSARSARPAIEGKKQ